MGIFEKQAYQPKYPNQPTVPPMPKTVSAEKITKVDKTLIVLKCKRFTNLESLEVMRKVLLKQKSEGFVIIPDGYEVEYIGNDDVVIIGGSNVQT